MAHTWERDQPPRIPVGYTKPIWLESMEKGLRFPHIVYHQGILESNWFQSVVYKENNNWLGLKCANYRKTYCQGTRRGHAVFKSRHDCLLDYLEWQKKYLPIYESKYGKVVTDEDYYDFLLKYNYAEDRHYIRKLRKIKRQLK